MRAARPDVGNPRGVSHDPRALRPGCSSCRPWPSASSQGGGSHPQKLRMGNLLQSAVWKTTCVDERQDDQPTALVMMRKPIGGTRATASSEMRGEPALAVDSRWRFVSGLDLPSAHRSAAVMAIESRWTSVSICENPVPKDASHEKRSLPMDFDVIRRYRVNFYSWNLWQSDCGRVGRLWRCAHLLVVLAGGEARIALMSGATGREGLHAGSGAANGSFGECPARSWVLPGSTITGPTRTDWSCCKATNGCPQSTRRCDRTVLHSERGPQHKDFDPVFAALAAGAVGTLDGARNVSRQHKSGIIRAHGSLRPAQRSWRSRTGAGDASGRLPVLHSPSRQTTGKPLPNGHGRRFP